MAEDSKIEWTEHTFNPWWGCAKVSAACRSCYADTTASRYGKHLWGRNADRQIMSTAYWRKPLKWNRDAQAAGRPARVFCASMADVFEQHPALAEPRGRLWDLIGATPWLTWLLLTKRPENIRGMVPDEWLADWPAHVWPGATVEQQRFAPERIGPLLALGARTTFVSCEPLLGPLDLRDVRGVGDALTAAADRRGLSWVIDGGESGSDSRPTRFDWYRSLRDQCADTDVPYLHKQNGTWVERFGPNRPDGLANVDPWKSPSVANVDAHGKRHPHGDFAGAPEHAAWVPMQKTTKQVAGRLLDGRTHDGHPTLAVPA